MSSLFKFPVTFEDFQNDYPPSNLDVLFVEFQTIEDSISNGGITLRQIEETYGLESVVNYLSRWLKAIDQLLNINKPLKFEGKVAFKILEKFSHLHLTDLKLVGDKILLGEGVQFYGSVDTQALLMAFSDYSRERRQKLLERNTKGEKEKVDMEEKKGQRRFKSEDLTDILCRMGDPNIRKIVEGLKENDRITEGRDTD